MDETYQPHYRLSFLLNIENLENSLKFAPDLKLVRLLSFKYRQQLFRKRKWASILTTLLSIYGLLVAFILAEIEIRCLEGDSGSKLKHQYHCDIEFQTDNTTIEDHRQFCGATESVEKLKVLTDNCTAFGMVNKLRWSITVSTVVTLIFTLMYQYFEIRIFKFDNSLSPSVILISRDLYIQIATERKNVKVYRFLTGSS